MVVTAFAKLDPSRCRYRVRLSELDQLTGIRPSAVGLMTFRYPITGSLKSRWTSIAFQKSGHFGFGSKAEVTANRSPVCDMRADGHWQSERRRHGLHSKAPVKAAADDVFVQRIERSSFQPKDIQVSR